MNALYNLQNLKEDFIRMNQWMNYMSNECIFVIILLKIIIKSVDVFLDAAYNISTGNKYLHQSTQLTLSGDTLTITDT
jgi:hypothetical protein